MSSITNFKQSGDCFVDVLGELTPELLNAPALGGWDVRSLAGHTARAILTVETYLSHDEPGSTSVDGAEAYYSTIYPALFDPRSIEADGVSAGVWLADDGAEQVADALARTCSLIETQPGNRVISIGGMGILLSEYLRTRAVELVLHTADLSHATGIEHRLPYASIAASVELVGAVEPHLRHGEQRILDRSLLRNAATAAGATPVG